MSNRFAHLVFFFVTYCKIFGKDPLIFISNELEISVMDSNTSVIDVITSGLERSFSLDYDPKTGYLYWTDVTAHTLNRIKYPSYDGNVLNEVIVPGNLLGQRPFGVAIDSKKEHLYWTDPQINALKRSNLDGSNQITITENIGYAWGVALDLQNSKIYFAVYGEGRIERCQLDGSQREIFISSTEATSPAMIYLDFSEDRVYWTDTGSSRIKSATFDGTDIQTVTSGVSGVHGIQVYENFIYYSIWYNGEVWRIDKTGQNSRLLFKSSIDVLSLKIYEDNDGCSSYEKIQSEEKRSKEYILETSVDTPFSDESIQEGWYRVISNNGDFMPSSPPGVRHCGTFNPIWLNGTLPSQTDGNVTEIACIQTDTDICEEMIPVGIRNCGGYYLYKLQQTPNNSSYCFGEGPVECPIGMSSETGFYPGCTSSFPPETLSVVVDSQLLEGQSFPIPGYDQTPSLIPVFVCKFNKSTNGSYVHDVHWYINGESVKVKINIPYDDMISAVLRDTDWVDIYQMNMEVQCAVRMRYSDNSTPGPFFYSPHFQAGLFPAHYEYTVIEGESVDITFTSTVPVGCIASHSDIRQHCDQNFYLFQPNHDSSTSKCTNNIVNRDILFKAQFCGIQLGSLDWKEKKYLKVYGFSDGMYNSQDRTTYIRLATLSFSTFNEVWQKFRIEDIKVTVIDKDSSLINRVCQSYNDPHITTFDGRLYHYMEVGEFVLYQNDKGPYWVHALLTNCGYGWQGSACHCGIAVRSRNSLYVLRTCKTISRTEKHLLQEPIIELNTCDDRDLIIEHTGNIYKITLPTGTEIKFTISRWSRFIGMISIKPSIFDINTAKGLCGVPSKTKDPSDDFTHRQNGPISDDQSFGDSWRVTTSSEQLFVEEPEFLNEHYVINTENTGHNNNLTRYCTCERQAGSADSLEDFSSVQCNLTESTEYCSEQSLQSENTINAFYTTCLRSTRKKRSAVAHHSIIRRSVVDDDDVVEFIPLTYDNSVNDSNAESPVGFRDGWTEENAYQTCLEKIRNTVPSYVYSDLVDLNESSFINSCVMDIKLTADTAFLTDTIDTMMTYIITELLKNETLYLQNSTDDSQTMLEFVTSSLCTNNCSDYGKCILGICHCEDGYVGEDCSHETSIPPENISLPFGGLCSIRDRICQRTNVYGNFLSSNVWYQIRHFQIHEDTVLYTTLWEVYKAEYRNMFMVSIDLKRSRKKRSTSEPARAEGNEIRLSNDGTTFGESVTIVIYDDECYSCTSSSLRCIIKENCSLSTEKTGNTKENDKTLVVIGGTVGGSVAVIFIVVVLLYSIMKSNHSKKQVDTGGGNDSNTGGVPNPYYTDLTREKTISDLELHVDDSRCGTPLELFECPIPPKSHIKTSL